MQLHTNNRFNLIPRQAPLLVLVLVFAILALGSPRTVQAATAGEINRDVDKQAFADATRGVWAMFEKKVGKENIEKIVATK